MTERMVVTILEDVNSGADADFKRLKDIDGDDTIYLRKMQHRQK